METIIAHPTICVAVAGLLLYVSLYVVYGVLDQRRWQRIRNNH